MDDKASLLGQLRIDRSPNVPRATRRRGIALVVAGVLAAAFIAGYAFTRPSGIPIEVATAHEIDASLAADNVANLDASGYVVARRQATVSSRITGKVAEIVVTEGQRVKKNEAIARLDDSNYRVAYEQAQAQVRLAEANTHVAHVAFDDTRPKLERYRMLIDQGAVSAQELDNAKAAYDAAETALAASKRSEEVARATLDSAKQNLSDCIIRAPFAGVVTALTVQAGEIVSPIPAGSGFAPTGIATIVDMDSLEVDADVNENFINRVRVHQPVSVRVNAYPNENISAEVIAVHPVVDRAKGTVKIRIGFKLNDQRIFPGMGARVSFMNEKSLEHDGKVAGIVPAVVVPVNSVQVTGNAGVVFVVNDNKVERRTVRLGPRVSGGRIVVSGVTAGTKVAIGDLTLLNDQMEVKMIERQR